MKRSDIPLAEYSKVHYWLKKNYGKASQCEMCHIKGKKYSWALKKDCNYETKRENFMELCYYCHRRYDDTIESRQKMSRYVRNALKDGSKIHPSRYLVGLTRGLSPRAIRVEDINTGKIYDCVKDAAEANNMSSTSLCDYLKGKTKSKIHLRYYDEKVNNNLKKKLYKASESSAIFQSENAVRVTYKLDNLHDFILDLIKEGQIEIVKEAIEEAFRRGSRTSLYGTLATMDKAILNCLYSKYCGDNHLIKELQDNG